MSFDMSQFETAKNVTMPVLKIEDGGKAVFIKIDGPIHDAPAGEGRSRKDAEGNDIKPPKIMDVTNLETNLPNKVVCNAVLASELEQSYPEQSYIDKLFKIEKHNAGAGKRYKLFTITELRPKAPASAESAVSTAASHITAAKKAATTK